MFKLLHLPVQTKRVKSTCYVNARTWIVSSRALVHINPLPAAKRCSVAEDIIGFFFLKVKLHLKYHNLLGRDNL